MVTKLMLSLYFRKSSFIYWKKTAAPPPPRKPNGLAVTNKKIKSREHSSIVSIPTLLGTAAEF